MIYIPTILFIFGCMGFGALISYLIMRGALFIKYYPQHRKKFLSINIWTFTILAGLWAVFLVQAGG